MSFQALVTKAWEQNALMSVLLELTYRCNLDCSFCYNDRTLKGQPLSFGEYVNLFSDLQDMQVLNLIFSGGEPLTHPDFLALGAAARERGFVVRIKTNGHALDERLAERVAREVEPQVLEISLHGAVARTHDRQTQVPGSFERLMVNLGHAQRAGLKLRLNATLTRWNEEEVEAMWALADRLGLPLRFDPDVTPRDNGDRSPLALAPTAGGVLNMLSVLQARSGGRENGQVPSVDNCVPSSGKHCGAGSSALAIDPYGNVYPCVQWRRAVGNIHQTSIRELWQTSPVLHTVRSDTRDVKRVLKDQPLSAGMAFCPGAAEAHTGSHLGLYPMSQTRAAAWQRIKGPARLPILA